MSNQGVNLYSYQKQQPNFSAQGPNLAMQGQTVENNYIANRAKASQDADPLTTLGLTAGIGYGIGQAMDKFGPKCEGEYKDTILGKLGEKGDNFSKNTKVGRFIENTFQSVDNWLVNKAKTNKLAYWLKYHSTSPEWQFAKMPFHGLSGYWSMDMANVIEQDLRPISAKPTKLFMLLPGGKVNDFNRLGDYGMTKDAIKAFEDSLSGNTFEQKAIALQKKELEFMGYSSRDFRGKTLEQLQEMAKDWKIKERYKCADYAELENKLKHILDDKDGFMKWLKDVTKNGEVKISINKFDNSLWGKIKSHFGGRTVTLTEYYNKGLAAMGKANKSVIGRALPKTLGWLVEGGTNRFAGGKLAPFIQATIFADMAYHVYKAPKNEKGKTLAERLVNDFMYFVGSTLGLIGIHKIGGLKYLGTDAAGREAYRLAQKAVNEQNALKGFATKANHKAAKKAADALLNTKGLKWWQKPLQKLGCLVNMGNEHFKPYLSPAKHNMNWLRRITNTNVIGVPLRIWLVMFAIMPAIVKAATKTAHAIFGKPTNSVLDEDNEAEDSNNSQDPSFNGQQSQQNNPQQVNPAQQPINPNQYQDSNLIKQAVNGQKPNQNSASQNDSTKMEPKRTYIPSPAGMVPQGPDTTALDAALAQADEAEKQIQQILAGNKNLNI